MKALRQFAALVVAIIIALFAFEVGGQTANSVIPPVQVLAIGSTNAVVDAEATNVTAIGIYIRQTLPPNKLTDYFVTTTNLTRQLTNKQDLDALTTSLVQQYAPLIPSCGTNQSLPFTVFVPAFNQIGLVILYCNYQLSLVQSNGSYQLPPIPVQFTNKLYPWSAFPFPGIKSALVEAQINGPANGWTPVMDSRWSPSNPWYWNADGTGGGVDVNRQILILPTAYVTGNYPLRVVTVSGSTNGYQLMNEMGYLIPETPTSVSESFVGLPQNKNMAIIDGQIITVTAQGGDPGRSMVIQKSSDLRNWTNATTNHIVGYIEADPGFSFSESASATQEFYRVASTNASF